MKFKLFYTILFIFLSLSFEIKLDRKIKKSGNTPEVIDQGSWGICGFVAVVNSLHTSGVLEQHGIQLSKNDIEIRLGAEIISYLKDRKANNSPILNQILDFTKSFGDQYDYKTTDNVIKMIEERVRNASQQSKPAIYKQSFGLAMTSKSIQDYLEYVGKNSELLTIENDAVTNKNLKQYKNCVVGLGKGKKEIENGLKHWVYVDQNSKLYNWGKLIDLDDSENKVRGIEDYNLAYIIKIK